jgi:hypothetical protein
MSARYGSPAEVIVFLQELGYELWKPRRPPIGAVEAASFAPSDSNICLALWPAEGRRPCAPSGECSPDASPTLEESHPAANQLDRRPAWASNSCATTARQS